MVEDPEWLAYARRRMIAGQAPHLEMFFLSHKYGRPKAVDHAPDRPPIVFISAHGQPGDYDPLARHESAELAAGAPLPAEGRPTDDGEHGAPPLVEGPPTDDGGLVVVRL